VDDGGASETDVRALAWGYHAYHREAFGDDRQARLRWDRMSLEERERSAPELVDSIVSDGEDPLPLLDALLDVAEEADDLDFLFFVAAGAIEDAIVERRDLRESIAVRCSLDARWRFTVEHGVWVDEGLLPSLPAPLNTLLAASATHSSPAPERRSRVRGKTWRSQRAQARRRRR
jgi:hypothetical protein